MGVAVGIFFLGILGAEIRWGVILPPPPLAILRWRKTLSRRRLNIAAKMSGKELVSLFSAMRPSKQHCHKNGLANLNRLANQNRRPSVLL